MAQAIFIFKTSDPLLADFLYTDNGVEKGGYTLVDSPDPIKQYWIEASPSKIAAMKADTTNYEWVEDIVDNS